MVTEWLQGCMDPDVYDPGEPQSLEPQAPDLKTEISEMESKAYS